MYILINIAVIQEFTLTSPCACPTPNGNVEIVGEGEFTGGGGEDYDHTHSNDPSVVVGIVFMHLNTVAMHTYIILCSYIIYKYYYYSIR